MKTIVKTFGQPETPEVAAVRTLLQTPGFAQEVERIEHLNARGEVVGKTSWGLVPAATVAERYVLTDAGAAKHDEILAAL